jgi:WhiB family redox-sensing transcriptional regulator
MTARNWTAEAVCARIDSEAWFPEVGGSPKAAKAICRTCPVVAECLQWAMDTNERWGVWGATTYEDRIKLRRKSQKAAA